MIEGLLLIVFFVIGGLAGLAAVILLIISLFQKSKGLFFLGSVLLLIPLFLYGISYWFYDVHLAGQYKKEEALYAGTYRLENTQEDNAARLVLHLDNTFELDNIEGINFSGKGSWKAGQTDDGQFTFYKDDTSIAFWAFAYNGNMLVIEENNRKFTFIKTE